MHPDPARLTADLRVSDIPDLVLSEEIRVQLDRETVIRLDPRVRLTVGRAGDVAEQVYPPWYESDGRRVDHDDPSAVPRTIAELSDGGDADGRHPVVPLALPCYLLPDGHLCLDGNHRLCAAFSDNPDLTVVLLSIEGPVDRAILPDLRFWEPAARGC